MSFRLYPQGHAQWPGAIETDTVDEMIAVVRMGLNRPEPVTSFVPHATAPHWASCVDGLVPPWGREDGEPHDG